MAAAVRKESLAIRIVDINYKYILHIAIIAYLIKCT